MNLLIFSVSHNLFVGYHNILSYQALAFRDNFIIIKNKGKIYKFYHIAESYKKEGKVKRNASSVGEA